MAKRTKTPVTGEMDFEKIKRAVSLFLEGIGEDPCRPGIVDTPDRVARMCREILYGTHKDPVEVIKVLRDPGHDEIVLVKDKDIVRAIRRKPTLWPKDPCGMNRRQDEIVTAGTVAGPIRIGDRFDDTVGKSP